MLRAGFTDVLVVKPMANGAKPAAAIREKEGHEEFVVYAGAKARPLDDLKPRLAAGDAGQHASRCDRTQQLHDDIAQIASP